MKNIYLFAITACLFLASCDNNSNPSATPASQLRRNTSVTQANAYNDLFLDSSALENFIAQQNLNEGKQPA